MSKPLNKMTVKALKAMCKEMKLKKYSRMKKAELITHIETMRLTLKERTEMYAPTPVPVIVEEIKEPTPEPVLSIKTDLPPLPPNLSTSPMTPQASPLSFEDRLLMKLSQDENIRLLNHKAIWMINCDYEKFKKQLKEVELKTYQPIVEEQDEILSDLDDLIENYDEELKKQEEEDLARMKKELLEKIEQEQKADQEKQLNKMTEQLVNDTIKQSKQEVQLKKH